MRNWLRSVFHWQYSGVVIGLLFTAGIGMITYDHFLPAYFFLIGAGIWALVYWQVSDHLSGKYAELKRREKFRNKPKQSKALVAFRKARFDYYRSSVIGFTVIFLVTVGLALWTHSSELEYELSLPSGELIPADDPMPDLPAACAGIRPATLMLFFGAEAIEADHSPRPVFTFNGRDALTMFKKDDGSLAISVDFVGPDKKLLARIEKNQFTVSQSEVFQRKRPDRHTLIIYDSYGNEVLNMRYLNRRAIRITGEWWVAGLPSVYGPWPAHQGTITGCMGDGGRIDLRY